MSFHRLLNSVLKFSRTSVIARRNISEYSKRFGYEVKVPDMEVKVNWVKNFLYIAGATLFLGDIAWDKQKHYEVFMKHYDETKKYSDPTLQFGYLAQPDMSFLIEDSNRKYHDEDCVPLNKIRMYPDRDE